MEQIPDAPWIREAEMYGIPSPEYPVCEHCGEEAHTLYRDKYGEIVGCEHCMKELDAAEWLWQKREDEKYDR